jgi:hypothetical protein
MTDKEEGIAIQAEPINERALLHRKAAILEEVIERWKKGIKERRAELKEILNTRRDEIKEMEAECKTSKKQLSEIHSTLYGKPRKLKPVPIKKGRKLGSKNKKAKLAVIDGPEAGHRTYLLTDVAEIRAQARCIGEHGCGKLIHSEDESLKCQCGADIQLPKREVRE